MIQRERLQRLNFKDIQRGQYVLYWMQASQRAEWNHALEHAIDRANELGQPLVALFGLTDAYPEANLRHYAFLLQGLAETQAALRDRGVQLVLCHASPERAAAQMAQDASLVVTDRGYLRVQKRWRKHVAEAAPCSVVQVETDVVVPVKVVSGKEEYAAATIRPRIHKHLEKFLVPLDERKLRKDSLGLQFESLDAADTQGLLGRLKVDRSVPPQGFYLGGTSRARERLADFIETRLDRYHEDRNDPSLGIWSNLSPYLQFGQVSPLYVAREIEGARGRKREAKDAFLEELVVRRELSMNFVHYNPRYDSYRCLPHWARETLEEHKRDRRETVYTAAQLEAAQTRDRYWNAAMGEMKLTGKMANYMRMYWGKKVMEWTRTPRFAFRTLLSLNNKYFLDGRNPNSFAGVAWCFGKHDRPWAERPVFGKVRYMSAGGLERKFDIDAYVAQVAALRGPAGGEAS
ncbi:MAG: deoxyribodipyrimidine photo-lyase [Candidatus Brocadiia bacterium]